ncbi:DNA polymerase III subunit psi [Vibrio ostreicida]|uniref:DNA polymerase III subunit psi n=1 Tax=Vibrio ostreicida TaxID=526588 RepID=A0ABT8BSM4_9VIBR|nr:DNA polymerase III subunit psi [Vibrio ostreicida]MDN3609113.1 DNA polymerase III subunit psi [Vibrio ostreicida]NPD08006.1 DNA polymerase III subunit psi [Vibrio ostreicida]
MNQDDPLYLQEMGIQMYVLHHPERLQGYQSSNIHLPDDCRLLVVAPSLPQDRSAQFFERVLKSLDLSINQSRHLYPEQIYQLGDQHQEWVWFAGCEHDPRVMGKVLQSTDLNSIEGNHQHKKFLWQQICSYQ